MNPYGKINNLSHFIHPKFKEYFRYMNDLESVSLASKILNKFIQSGYTNIVIMESGTSPLINIINKLKHNDLNFIQLKVPRDLDFNLINWLKSNLSLEELNTYVNLNNQTKKRITWLEEEVNKFSLKDFISDECFTIYDSINDNYEYDLKQVNNFEEILEGTYLSNILSKPFLLFDEYINAGTIIRNFNGMVRLFTSKPSFKLSAFCMFLDNPENNPKIAFTIYNNESELECYRKGAYPFENRVDLIGYYYFINKENFTKISLSSIIKELKINKELDIKTFYQELENIINSHNLLKLFRKNITEKQVRSYVSNKDIARYMTKLLEKTLYGENKYYDLLDQVFEIYAPSWSPMPVIFHLDYWASFDKVSNEINKAIPELYKSYLKYRDTIIYYLLKKLEKNNHEWNKRINKIIGGSNENN